MSQFAGSPDKHKRKFQCFACGESFEDFVGYKLHIESEHELGRDYIKCPRCDAPIRDMKLHWKVKHPHFPEPTGVQHRAIIFRDFRPDGTKKKTRKPTFATGDHKSTKTGKTLHYRSGYELATYKLLDELNEVVSYDAEPLQIQYLFEGKTHNYIPDISVLWNDGKKSLLEIKPKTQTNLPVNKAKWAAAKNFCTGRGWDFEVMTEAGINQLRWRVVRQKKASS